MNIENNCDVQEYFIIRMFVFNILSILDYKWVFISELEIQDYKKTYQL